MARLVIEVKGKDAEATLRRLRKEAKAFGGTVRKLEPAVNRADRSLAKMAKTSSLLTTAVKGLIIGIGVRGLTRALRGATDAAIEQSQAEAQLTQGILSTGGAAGHTSEELTRLAKSLQQFTLFGDEAIIRAESILLTFTKIQGETFPATTRAVLDLATRMGGDLSAAAVQLGKALNDPVANLGELGRAGIQFSKDQKLVIKSLFEGGDAAGAQAIILEELTRQFGGSAEAAAKAGGGGIKQFTNALGDAQEVLGEQLLPTLDELGRKGVVILSHTAEAAALMKVGFISLGIAIDKVTISAAKFFLVFKKLGAFTLGPWSTTQDKVVADLELQIARWEILAGGSVLKARQAYEEYLDAATRAGSASKALAEALSGGGAGVGGVEGAANAASGRIGEIDKRIRELTESIKVVREASDKAARAVREAWRLEDQISAIDEAFEDLSLTLGGITTENPLEVFPDRELEQIVSDAWEMGISMSLAASEDGPPMRSFADTFGRALSQALFDHLNDGIDWRSFGAQIGAGLADSGVFGDTSTAGGAFAANFAVVGISETFASISGQKTAEMQARFAATVAELNRAVEALIDKLFSSLGGPFNQVIDTFERIRDIFAETIALGRSLEQAFAASGRELEILRNSLLGIQTDGLAQTIAAAVEFNQQLETMAQLLTTTGQQQLDARVDAGEFGVDQFGTPEDAEQELRDATENMLSQVAEALSGLPEALDLTQVTENLISQFVGVSLEFMSVQATADNLRSAITLLNITEEEQLRLIGLVTQAEQIRMATLENDVLQRLVNVLSLIPSMQEDAAQLQSQINQARFQIEVAMIQMQLNALGLMTDAFSAMLKVAVAFGEELSNFNVSLGGRSFNFRAPRGFRGGGGVSSGIDQAQQDMEALIATLQGLASEPAFNTLNDRMRELHQTFFGPGGFAEEARRLGVSMDLVNAAFRRQRQNLMDEANRGIRQFLEGLGTSRFNPGGIGAQFGSAQSTFDQLLAQANRGDLDARAALPDAAQQLLDFGGQALGTSSAAFRHLFEMVQGSLEGILGVSGGNVLGFEVRAQVLATNEVRTAVDRVGDILLGTFTGGGAAGQTAAVQSGEQIAQLQAINVQLVNLQRETAELRADRRAERVVAPRKHQIRMVRVSA